MCDTENLIIAVEKYPCLWDVSHESYHDRDIKDLAWEEVCLEIIKDWDSTNDEEKKKKCAETKKKWNNVRDCYRRDINKVKHTPTGSCAKKQKKYVYTDLLSFLAPIMQSRRHEGNYDDGGEGTSTGGTTREEDSQNIIGGDHITEEIPNNATKKKVTKDVPTQILEIIKQKKEQPVHDDDDTKFLLSFRSDMKEMNRIQKMDFKIGMLQLLKQISEPLRNVYSSHSSRSFNTLSPQMMFSPSPSPPNINIPSNIGRNTDRATYIPPNSRLTTTGPVPLQLPPPQPPSSPPRYSQHNLSRCADNGILEEYLQFNNN